MGGHSLHQQVRSTLGKGDRGAQCRNKIAQIPLFAMRRQAAFSLKLLQKVCWPRTGTIGRGSVRAGQPLTPNTCTAPVGSGRRPKAADRVKRDAVAAVETRRGSRISTRPPLPKINDSKNAAMVSEAVHSPLPSRPPSPVSVYLGHFSFPVRRRFEARSSPRLCSSVRAA